MDEPSVNPTLSPPLPRTLSSWRRHPGHPGCDGRSPLGEGESPMTRSHCRLIPVVVVLAAILLTTPAFSSPPPAQSWLPGGFALESAWPPLAELWRSPPG